MAEGIKKIVFIHQIRPTTYNAITTRNVANNFGFQICAFFS